MATECTHTAESNVKKRKFIIDCDTGVDDAVAILMMMQAKDNAEVLAITCVNGNCFVDQAVQNVLITLNITKQCIPVYRGCSKPLTVVSRLEGRDVHGADGLGGVAKDYAHCSKSLKPGHGVVELVRLVNKYPGEITLIALGPLTNIAMAYRLDDGFSSKLSRLVIMGGNTEGKGNVKLAAEFNFHIDPEAAKIVVEEVECPCQICGWELCGLNHALSWDWLDMWVAKAADERGRFIVNIVQDFISFRLKNWPESGFSICDPFAVSVALFPDIVTESTHRRVTVETAGHSTRGMLVAEWRDGQFPRNTKPVELVLKVDLEKHTRLLEMLMEGA